MAQDAAQPRAEWNYLAVFFALVVGLLLQSVFLPGLCFDGTVRMLIALGVDAIVAIRLIIARLLRERGKGWVFYAILPFLIIPVIMVLQYLWLHRH